MTQSSLQIPAFSFAGLKELRKRLLFVFVSLIIYRIGAHIPVPGLDLERLALLFDRTGSGLTAFFNMVSVFSGGALSQCTIFALGLGPYINISILVQLLSKVVPSLEQLTKEGELGRRKLNQYTRYGTVGLAVIYGFALTRWLVSSGVAMDSMPSFYVTAIITLVAGVMFLMWLGEQITDRGVGNGVSLIIFSGIVSGLPRTILQFIEQVRQGQISNLSLLIIILIVTSVTSFVVFMERAQRRITVNYPKRQQGRHIYAPQSNHLPLKLNMSGIMPTIFASASLMIPSAVLRGFEIPRMITQLTRDYLGLDAISFGQPLYMFALAAMTVFFCFFYTALVFNPREMADNLKKSGAFIPGIRPGEQSAQYLDAIMTRLTVVGSLYLLLVVLLPDIIAIGFKVPFAFGGTSLLIVIVVVMELIGQIQSLLISHQYEPLLKKSRLKGNISIR